MEIKTARLTLLIDPNKKAAFELLCARQDRSASQVVRQLIREYLAQHGVEVPAAGSDEEPAATALPLPGKGAAPASRPGIRTARTAPRRR